MVRSSSPGITVCQLPSTLTHEFSTMTSPEIHRRMATWCLGNHKQHGVPKVDNVAHSSGREVIKKIDKAETGT